MQPMMTNRGRFALTAMIDIITLSRDGPVSLAGLATRQDISKSYLEQLFAQLRRHGLVRATRGPGGGYLLGRDAAAISVADVLTAINMGQCARHAPAPDQAPDRLARDSHRFTDEGWAEVNRKLVECPATVSLEVLAGQLPEAPVSTKVVQTFKRGFLPRPAVVPFKASGPNSVFALGSSFSIGLQDEVAEQDERQAA